jgi:pyocin large subunit-like protein
MDWGLDMRVVLLLGAAALALTVAACGGPPSATGKATPTAASAVTPPTVAERGITQASAVDPRDLPPQLLADGKPMWAPNRNHTAQENADYQFGKNGKDFSAASEAQYVVKVHAFVDRPPPGVQKIERANGDALLYDAKTNTFAVVTKTGAPRTMFKPRDGAAYWRQQVAREAARSKGDSGSDS